MTELVLVCFLRGCVCFARQGGFTCVVVFVFIFFAASAALPSCAAFSPRLGEPWVSRDSGGEPGARLHRERQHKWLSDRLLDANRNLKSEGFETPLGGALEDAQALFCHFSERLDWFLLRSSLTVQITSGDKNKNRFKSLRGRMWYDAQIEWQLVCESILKCSCHLMRSKANALCYSRPCVCVLLAELWGHICFHLRSRLR